MPDPRRALSGNGFWQITGLLICVAAIVAEATGWSGYVPSRLRMVD
jgi:hypothetical protein